MLHVQIQIVFLYYNLYLNTIIHFSGFLVYLIGLVDGETDVAFCD